MCLTDNAEFVTNWLLVLSHSNTRSGRPLRLVKNYFYFSQKIFHHGGFVVVRNHYDITYHVIYEASEVAIATIPSSKMLKYLGGAIFAPSEFNGF